MASAGSEGFEGSEAGGSAVTLVTGGAGGIGSQLCLALADRGDAVGVLDRDLAAAHDLAQQIRRSGGRGVGVAADVSDDAAMRQAFDTVEDALGPIGALYNNAGIPAALPLPSIDRAVFDRVIAVNVYGVIAGTREFAARIQERGGGGCVVNTCSVAGKRGFPGGSLYSASKFAVRGLTQSHAVELAPLGIRVNAVCPGMVDTPLWDEVARQRGAADSERPAVAAHNSLIALGRHATPEDVLGLALFLSNPASAYITGQAINVDGGLIFD